MTEQDTKYLLAFAAACKRYQIADRHKAGELIEEVVEENQRLRELLGFAMKCNEVEVPLFDPDKV